MSAKGGEQDAWVDWLWLTGRKFDLAGLVGDPTESGTFSLSESTGEI